MVQTLQRQSGEETRCGTGAQEHPPLVAGKRGGSSQETWETAGGGTVLGREGTFGVQWGQRPDRAVRKSIRGEVMKSDLLRELAGKGGRGDPGEPWVRHVSIWVGEAPREPGGDEWSGGKRTSTSCQGQVGLEGQQSGRSGSPQTRLSRVRIRPGPGASYQGVIWCHQGALSAKTWVPVPILPAW